MQPLKFLVYLLSKNTANFVHLRNNHLHEIMRPKPINLYLKLELKMIGLLIEVKMLWAQFWVFCNKDDLRL